tara:strand:+ start:1661 stop:1837 length:177 start_codon:yes stop_codon:yes gene_type:complete
MQALVTWLTPKLFSWATSYFEDDKLESFITALLETAVKATGTKFDDEVLALYKKKLED